MRRLVPTALSMLLAGSVLAVLVGCAPKIPGIYRIDIQQGNVVDQDMLDRLEPGMEKRKVRFILGTPLLVDTFNQDRWDYLYSISEGGGTRQQRHVSLYFEDERLARIEGDVQPQSGERADSGPKETMVLVPAERPSRGFFDDLTPDFLKKRKRRTVAAVEPAEEAVEAQPEASEAETGSSVDTAAGAAVPATEIPPTDTDETDDPGFLKRLLKGFGREDDSDAVSTQAGVGRDGEDASTSTAETVVESGSRGAVPTAPRVGRDSDETTDAARVEPDPPAAADEATGSETGFFKKLVTKFRKLRKGTASDSESASDSPPAPPTPGETDP